MTPPGRGGGLGIGVAAEGVEGGGDWLSADVEIKISSTGVWWSRIGGQAEEE